MKLHHKHIGEGSPLLILHGLFGSSDNWISIARKLGEHHSVYLIDLRNHGDSPHSDEFNYQSMVDDLTEFVQDHSINSFTLIGHSLGGKTAMLFASQYPEMVNELIVVDIAPKGYPVHHTTILEGLNSINLLILKSRSEADKILSQFVPEMGVRQFLLKNLKRTSVGFEWKINLPILENQIDKVGDALEARAKYNKPTLFLRGDLSNYILNGDIELIHTHFPIAKLITVKGASHWVHAEQPEIFLAEVNSFLNK